MLRLKSFLVIDAKGTALDRAMLSFVVVGTALPWTDLLLL